MRSFLIVLCCLASHVLIAQQNTLLVSYQASDKDLPLVLKELENQYDIKFSYAVNQLAGKKTTIKVRDEQIATFLNQLLAPHQLAFEQVESKFFAIKRAESISFQISVYDAISKESLPFAVAQVKGTNQGFVADGKGLFNINISKPKGKMLVLTYVGSEKKTVVIDEIDPTKELQLFLKPEAQLLPEVTVSEYLTKGISIGDNGNSINLDLQNLEILPGLVERDVLLSTQVLAGVGSIDESAGGINIRGAARDQTAIYWNNIPVYQASHYFGNISAFIPASIGKVSVMKNYVPVEYGGASAGVLFLTSRQHSNQKSVFETNLNGTHGDLYASIPLADNRWRVSMGLRRSYNDLFGTPTFNAISDKLFEGSLTQEFQGINSDFQYNSQLNFTDLNLVLSHSPSERDFLRLSFLNSDSRLSYDSTDEFGLTRSVQSHNVGSLGGNITWDRNWSEALQMNYSLSYSDYDMAYDVANFIEEMGVQNDIYAQNRTNHIDNLETRLQLTYKPGKKQSITAGYQWNKVNTGLTVVELVEGTQDFSRFNATEESLHAAFAKYDVKLKPRLKLGAGIRYNRFGSLNEGRWDGNLLINYDLSTNWLLKSSYAVNHQFISSLKEIQFVFSNTLEQSWVTSGTEYELPVISNEQWVIGVQHTGVAWVLDIEAYNKTVESPIALVPGNFPALDINNANMANEKIMGVDLTIKKRWENARTWLTYAFQDSEVSTGSIQFPSGLNIRHQMQLAQTFKIKDFELSVGYHLRSGLLYTRATGLSERPEDNDIDLDFEPLNSSRLPMYHRLDASVWYRFTPCKQCGLKGEVGLSVTNLTNARNIFSRSFGLRFSEQDELTIVSSEQQYIERVVNLSIRLNF